MPDATGAGRHIRPAGSGDLPEVVATAHERRHTSGCRSRAGRPPGSRAPPCSPDSPRSAWIAATAVRSGGY